MINFLNTGSYFLFWYLWRKQIIFFIFEWFSMCLIKDFWQKGIAAALFSFVGPILLGRWQKQNKSKKHVEPCHFRYAGDEDFNSFFVGLWWFWYIICLYSLIRLLILNTNLYLVAVYSNAIAVWHLPSRIFWPVPPSPLFFLKERKMANKSAVMHLETFEN